MSGTQEVVMTERQAKVFKAMMEHFARGDDAELILVAIDLSSTSDRGLRMIASSYSAPFFAGSSLLLMRATHKLMAKQPAWPGSDRIAKAVGLALHHMERAGIAEAATLRDNLQ